MFSQNYIKKFHNTLSKC